MVNKFNFKKVLPLPGSKIRSDLEPYESLQEHINRFAKEMENQPDQYLRKLSVDLMKRSADRKDTEDFIVTGFGLVKEVIKRVLKITPYDVQILGGIALYREKLIEMQTGEGKTLTAVFPAYLRGLENKGVHILTFNDYLAKRDAHWMGPVYKFLGLSVGYIQEGMDRESKKAAYNCDITYATAKEAGFDYLRSFVAYKTDDIVLRPFHYCIIDEADAILIDEAKNPLVLAGDIIKSGINFNLIAEIVSSMKKKVDFDMDEYSMNIYLTEKGIERIENELSVQNLQADENYELHSAINLAIHARTLLSKDVDYVIRDKEVKLVDEFTGRIVEDRKWRNGLQTAVEAKEGIAIQSEGNILNSISMQHFILQYPIRSGMTATARDSTEEFSDFYGLSTVVIPPNRPCSRKDHQDQLYITKEAKSRAIIEEVKKANKTGQPVLIGTLTVKESEELAGKFRSNGINIEVLNAKNDEREAEIIACAGKPDVVTISTNMAGRGTDIILGGKDGSQKKEVICNGGLYVIGTNRHESQRIDKQLRGRAGRQGDIGVSRFFTSMDDTLMVKYRLRETLPPHFRDLSGDYPIENKFVKKLVNHVQRVIEGQGYDIRKTLVGYSGLVEKQRVIIQSERQKILYETDRLFAICDLTDPDLKRSLDYEAVVKKLRNMALYYYDRYWASHLDYLQAVRDSIHLVRIGGQNPLREFQKKADKSFKETCRNIDQQIQEKAGEIIANPEITPAELGIRIPSSTWTYMINDNPFGNQLSIFLLDNSNIGFQADPVSGILLGMFGLFERIKQILRLSKNE
ncbi:MAG: accessory Sec system translocase SecA2 [Bacteroidales bacterium]|nr:MAG: accessory Sec system translocase SecA2 [Bacteroidales bacterium]